MRVFIQATPEGIPRNHNLFIANQGFREMGFETICFTTLEDISDSRQDDLIVGGIGAVTGKLKAFGICGNIEQPSGRC